MRIRQIFWLIAISILFINTVCLPNLFAQFAGGSGTQANPWQVATAEQLDYVRNFLGVEHSTKHFIQIADIDLGVSPWNEGEGWHPIGSGVNGMTSSFTGSYDGNGYIIDGLYINRPGQTMIGLFGSTYGATITNLGVINVEVSGEAIVGGLIGVSEWSYISNSHSTGNINAGSNQIFSSGAGGLIGAVADSFVSNSYNVSRVTALGAQVGGFIGSVFTSTIENCFSNSIVDGPFVGGFIGDSMASTISNCYSTGVADYGYTSGFADWVHYSTINNCYSFTEVNGSDTSGFIMVADHSVIENCYWDIEVSGTSVSAVGEGRTTAEMTFPYAANTYVNWGFQNEWVEDHYMIYNNGYPYLSWQTFHFDFIPPSNLTALSGDEMVELDWNEPPDIRRSLVGYNVYRDDLQINQEPLLITGYQDNDVENQITYIYYVTAVYDEGESVPSNRVRVTPGVSSADEDFDLLIAKSIGNYPNPFNPETTIFFTLLQPERIKLEIYNIRGQKITTLLDEYRDAGEHRIVWNGKDSQGKASPTVSISLGYQQKKHQIPER